MRDCISCQILGKVQSWTVQFSKYKSCTVVHVFTSIYWDFQFWAQFPKCRLLILIGIFRFSCVTWNVSQRIWLICSSTKLENVHFSTFKLRPTDGANQVSTFNVFHSITFFSESWWILIVFEVDWREIENCLH